MRERGSSVFVCLILILNARNANTHPHKAHTALELSEQLDGRGRMGAIKLKFLVSRCVRKSAPAALLKRGYSVYRAFCYSRQHNSTTKRPWNGKCEFWNFKSLSVLHQLSIPDHLLKSAVTEDGGVETFQHESPEKVVRRVVTIIQIPLRVPHSL